MSAHHERRATSPLDQQLERHKSAARLVHEQVTDHVYQFWSNPNKRLKFVADSEGMLQFIHLANATIRNKTYAELQADIQAGQEPGFTDDKLALFRHGQEIITDHIETAGRRVTMSGSTVVLSRGSSVLAKLNGSAMAYEALITWTNLFSEGNGPTSRFIGRLIESGGDNLDDLVWQTAYMEYRQSPWNQPHYMSRQTAEGWLNNPGIILPNEQRAQFEEQLASGQLLDDKEALEQNLNRLLTDHDLRNTFLRQRLDWAR